MSAQCSGFGCGPGFARVWGSGLPHGGIQMHWLAAWGGALLGVNGPMLPGVLPPSSKSSGKLHGVVPCLV